MTKTEIYRALADGIGASVQRYSNCYEGDGEWLTAGSEYRLIGWLASDAANFNPERYRLKPTPVPPGDLTWEEAQAAFKRGEKVEWWSPYPKHEQSWKPWVSGDVFSDCKNLNYRIAPAPKMRTIKAEELPAVFYVKCKGYVPALVTAIEDHRIHCVLFRSEARPTCFDKFGWVSIDRLIEDGATYSEHHTNGPWNKFEVEDK